MVDPVEFTDKVISYIRAIKAFKFGHIAELRMSKLHELSHLMLKNSITAAVANALKDYPEINSRLRPYLIPQLTKIFFSYIIHGDKELVVELVSKVLS